MTETRTVVSWNYLAHHWEVWDRKLLAVRGYFARREGALCSAAQLELDL